MTFPKRLRALRKRLEITQPEAAAICEENLRTWKAYELGDSTPKPCHHEGILARLQAHCKDPAAPPQTAENT